LELSRWRWPAGASFEKPQQVIEKKPKQNKTKLAQAKS